MRKCLNKINRKERFRKERRGSSNKEYRLTNDEVLEFVEKGDAFLLKIGVLLNFAKVIIFRQFCLMSVMIYIETLAKWVGVMLIV